MTIAFTKPANNQLMSGCYIIHTYDPLPESFKVTYIDLVWRVKYPTTLRQKDYMLYLLENFCEVIITL